MSGTITSKNFKVNFFVDTSGDVHNVEFLGLGSEARKYLKGQKLAGDVYANLDTLPTILRGHETALRTFVLDRIGG